MDRITRRGLAAAMMITIALPALAAADGLGKKETWSLPRCYAWELQDVEETVYVVTYKKEKKKVKRPVIKETRKPTNCAVCQPFHFTVLHEGCMPEYKQSWDQTTKTVCHKHTDECGNCHASSECVPQPYSCLNKCVVPQIYPVTHWKKIPMETKWEISYLHQEMQDIEVEVEIPVLTPKKIKRQVWVKVPFCPPDCKCEKCSHGHGHVTAAPACTTCGH